MFSDGEMIIVMMEPEGAFRCNEPGCDWLPEDQTPEQHGELVHGTNDVMVVHPDDH